jgi:hypothetical protein
MPLTQATTLNPPQWEPAQVAAGSIPVNRLEALDAVFAASDDADQDRRMGLDSGNPWNDYTDALFAPDELASWGVKLTILSEPVRE